MAPEIQKLRTYCKRWGGSLVEVSSTDYSWYKSKESRTFSEAPFSSRRLGVRFDEKQVVYEGEIWWPEVIHEMGHIFCSDVEPYKSNEYEFIGWEYVLAKKIGNVQEWVASNADYGLGRFSKLPANVKASLRARDETSWDADSSLDLGCLNAAEIEVLMTERIAFGKKLGIISSRGNPQPLSSRTR